MAIIYKITNLVNQKSYIGETTRTLEKRWAEHKYESFNEGHGYNYHLHTAIRKYGIENFKIEKIEECLDEYRFIREHYFIIFYNTQEPNGYNFLVSGNGSVKVPIESILELWNEGKNTVEIGKILGLDRQTVSNHLKASNISQEEIMQRHGENTGKRSSKSVLQYDLIGNFIQQWSSASNIIVNNKKLSQGAISSVCRQQQKSAYGFLWKYAEDLRDIQEWVERYNNKQSAGKPKKSIAKLSINKEVLQIYSSASEAAKDLNLKDKSNICAAARKERKAYGYYWKYI